MNDEKIKEIRSWARTILEDSRKDSGFFNNGVVEAAEFILEETENPVPEGSLLFRKAEHPDHGEVTVISERAARGYDGDWYINAVRSDPEAASGTVIHVFKVDDLDFYPDGKSNVRTRLDFHSLKTGTTIRAFREGLKCPTIAFKVSINRWAVAEHNLSYNDQDMEDFGYEWEVI